MRELLDLMYEFVRREDDGHPTEKKDQDTQTDEPRNGNDAIILDERWPRAHRTKPHED